MERFDYNNYAYFVLRQDFMGGTHGFTGYTDRDGNACFIWDGRTDRNGNPIPRKFKFSRKERVMRIPLKQKDKNGVSVVEFLEKHPDCDGSPNAEPGRVAIFARMNDERDATKALEAKRLRLKAENHVLELSDEDAMEIATLFGVFTDKPAIARHALLENAGNEPDSYLSIVNDPLIDTRIVLRKAMREGIVERKGGIYKWEGEVLGADENDAVKKLIKDAEVYDALTHRLYGGKSKVVDNQEDDVADKPENDTVEKDFDFISLDD